MVLIMPEDLSVERRQGMAAYGAQIVLTPVTGGMEYARDLAEQMQREGKGIILDQFANPDNPIRAAIAPVRKSRQRDRRAYYALRLGPWALPVRLWACRRYLKEQKLGLEIIGAQPEVCSRIPGIRKWPESVSAEDFRP